MIRRVRNKDRCDSQPQILCIITVLGTMGRKGICDGIKTWTPHYPSVLQVLEPPALPLSLSLPLSSQEDPNFLWMVHPCGAKLTVRTYWEVSRTIMWQDGWGDCHIDEMFEIPIFSWHRLGGCLWQSVNCTGPESGSASTFRFIALGYFCLPFIKSP